MPHTLAEIFTHAHLLDFKSWAGRGYRARHVTCAASRADLSGRPALLQHVEGAAETTDEGEGRYHGRQNRRWSFCSGRGENLVTSARFGKPLFANVHHRVHVGHCGSQTLHARAQAPPLDVQ